MTPRQWRTWQYGANPLTQYVRLWMPSDNDREEFPVAVLVHGGFWRNIYSIDNSCHDTLAPFLCSKGFAVIDSEYRRSDHEGGGYPGTNEDVLHAVNSAKEMVREGIPLNLDRIVLIGHSAGATLALWYAAKVKSDKDLICPRLIVAIAPITDVRQAQTRQICEEQDAIAFYMKCKPEDGFEAETTYSSASPIHLLPNKVRSIVVAGRMDTIVPYDMITSYFDQVKDNSEYGPRHELLELDADHFQMVDAQHPAFQSIFTRIEARLCSGE
ncbi:hypothetical protein NDN08_006268 [Rhodosorus marinus]|uniref:BD-FAE-like domain-containing protein n=1 Tax=Rhodosorus marinus TaxID=101924 RepID=A0AAV8UQT7_9RHOD|nr:hypothetical protein NDN08_006268 [Rhodosorus marinus]